MTGSILPGVDHFDLVVSDLELYRGHVAFAAPYRDVVEDRLRWADEHCLEIESAPREYDYRPGYYAGLFSDPDGIKLEVVHAP